MAGSGPRVGVDVGGSKVHAALLDDDGAVLAEARTPTLPGPDGVLDSVTAAVGDVCAAAGRAPSDLAVVGVAVPGLVADGAVTHAVNLGIDAPVPLAAHLRDRLGVRVTLENDVNAGALGADRLLGLGGDVAFLALGTGVAAGLVLGGRLRRGVRHAAGEVGHLPYRPDGPVCGCGQRGCLELYASGSALAAAWPTDGTTPAAVAVFTAAGTDPAAARVRDRFADAVAAAARTLVLTVDVRHVVLGGGVAGLGAPLLDAVVAAARRQAAGSALLAHLDVGARLRLADRTLPLAPVGAALAGDAVGADVVPPVPSHEEVA